MYSFENSPGVRTSNKTALGVDFNFSEKDFASRTGLPPFEEQALKNSATNKSKLEYFMLQK